MFGKRARIERDFDLNLTPIIDCFVTLICFMLLSATYAALVGLDAKVPLAVPASGAEGQKEEPAFKLRLDYKKNGMELAVSGAGALSGRHAFPHAGVGPDLAALHEMLVRIKRHRPKEFTLNFNSDLDLPYSELIKVMDATRNLRAEDAKKGGDILVTDERNGKTLKMDVLFPDFIINGLGAQK